MAYAIGTQKEDGVVQPSESRGVGGAGSAGGGVSNTTVTETAREILRDAAANGSGSGSGGVSYVRNVGGGVSNDDWNKSATPSDPTYNAGGTGGGGVSDFSNAGGSGVSYSRVDPQTQLSFGQMLDFINTPTVSTRYLPSSGGALGSLMESTQGINFLTGLPTSTGYLDQIGRSRSTTPSISTPGYVDNTLLLGPDAANDPYSGFHNLTAGLRTLGILPPETVSAPEGALAPLDGLTTRKVPLYKIGLDGNPILTSSSGSVQPNGPTGRGGKRGGDARLPAGNEGTVYFSPGGDYGYNTLTGEYEVRRPGESYAASPLSEQERRALAMIGGNENPALASIETVTSPPVTAPTPRPRPLSYEDPIYGPQITESAYAGDLFETDGRAVTPEGVVLSPGGPARAIATSPGIDAAVKEPSTWDNVVDNTGKLLSHSGLGAIVSTLFPDLWSSGGDMMKGLFDGERGTATANGDFTRWDPREGVSMGGGSSFSRDASGYVDTTPNAVPGKGEPPVVPPVDTFPDLNHNGVDDRIEGYTGPDTKVPVVFDPPPTREVRFPDMPPYNPGRDAEWKYFTHNHLAEGGVVDAYGYAGGGVIDPSDPKVRLIGDTEDVLEDIKSGKKPDEAAAATLKAFVAQFGDGALKSLHDNVAGGMTMKSAGKGRQIKGPGGPKDDAVPAVIVEEGSVVSPAKLSNNEFVMPVEAVEGLGEGDIKLGAERMQQLAERLAAGKKAA